MSLPTSTKAFSALSADHHFIHCLDEAFGFPSSAFDGWTFWHREDSGAVWIARSEVSALPGVPIGALGMIASKNLEQPTRLSAAFIQRFGALATRGVITLGPDKTRLFASGTRQPWPDSVEPRHHVIVLGTLLLGTTAHYIAPIGRGRFERGELCSDVPKALRFSIPES